MKHRIAVAACAAATLIAVACSDSEGTTRRLATEPGTSAPGQQAHYSSRGIAAVVGANHQLQSVAPPSSSPRPNASIAAPTDEASALTLATNEPGIATTGGRRNSSFVDGSRHRHIISMLYAANGGPPVAVQHYIDGKLVSTSAFSWNRTGTGWVRARSLLQSVRDGRLYGTYSTTTSTSPVGGGGGTKPTVRMSQPVAPNGFQRAIGNAAYHLAFIVAPQDATAQSLALGACSQYWLRYAAAAFVVVGIEAIIAEAPILTPALITQLGAALALLGAAEDQMLDCVLSHQPIPLFDNWSSGMGTGGGGGGSGGGSGSTKDCLEGSYAAHCTTAFTL